MTREEAIKALTIQLEYWEQLKEKNVLTDHEGNNVVDVLKLAIEALQQKPVKHGKWKVIIKTEDEMQARCSECKMVYFLGMGRNPNYCPNCGAKMDGKK